MSSTFDEIRWGQIGCGDVAERKSGPAFDRIAGSRRVAVMARNEARLRDYAGRHGIPRWTTDARRLIDDPEVNAVYIATPPDTHPAYTEMAAAAGKAVYVEKPMARTHGECLAMIEACRRAGVPLFVAYYRRCLEKFVRVKELLDGGAIGRAHTVALRLRTPPHPRETEPSWWRTNPAISGGGHFIDLASHQFDLLDWFFGPVIDAAGVKANFAGRYEVEDSVSATFSFADGPIGGGVWSFAVDASAACDETEIAGEFGVIRFSTFNEEPVVLARSGKVEMFAHPFPEHVHEPLLETVAAALRGQGPCPSTGESGARANFVLEAIAGLASE